MTSCQLFHIDCLLSLSRYIFYLEKLDVHPMLVHCFGFNSKPHARLKQMVRISLARLWMGFVGERSVLLSWVEGAVDGEGYV